MPLTAFDLGTILSTGGSTTVAFAANVPPGAFIYLWAFEKTTAGAFAGITTDSAGNSYSNVNAENPNSVAANGVGKSYYSFNVSPLFNGSILVPKSTLSTAMAIGGMYVLGVASSADPYETNSFNTASGNNNNPKVLSGANFRFQVPGEFVVANSYWVPDTGDTFSQSGGLPWASPPTTFISTAVGIGMAGGWASNLSIAATLYNPFLNNTRPWVTWIQGFYPGGDVGHDSTTLYAIGNY